MLLPELYLEYLGRNGKVNLHVYRRLKDDGIIEGKAFNVDKIPPYKGNFVPIREHEKNKYLKD